jgi:predicted amidohydrolase
LPVLRGADVLCFPTNWLGDKCPSATWLARAVENGVYVVAANRYGCERGVQFSGGSAMIGPDGTILAVQDTGDGIVAAEIDPARARDKHDRPDAPPHLLDDRRPEAYGNLTLNTYLYEHAWFHGLYGLRPLPDGRRSQIAVAQFDPLPGNVEGNLHRIAGFAAVHADADLLVLPELALSGSRPNGALLATVGEPIPGPATERLTEIATTYGLYLVAGVIERSGDHLYNSAVLVGPDGLAGTYRKLHPSATERAWIAPGDLGLPTFDTPLGRIGLQIGGDVWFPEGARCLAIDGADLIAWPSLVSGPAVRPAGPTAVPLPPPIQTGPTPAHVHLWRERARENATAVAFANGAAPAMGWSAIFGPSVEDDPADQVLIEGAAEGSLQHPLDTLATDLESTRAKWVLGLRMPIWYDDLQAPVVRPEHPKSAVLP